MPDQQIDYLQVWLPTPDEVDPQINVFAVDTLGQMLLRDAIKLGPFPDWEAIARRVWRSVVLDVKRSAGYKS